LRHNGFRLLTLGRLGLVHGPAGEEVPGCQRRKLALLAYLALAERPVPRASLVEMFWGDEEEERARHSLSNALWFLRRVLGPDSVTSRRADISLSPNAAVAIDAAELLEAAKRGDHSTVAELYTGPFLDGVYISESDTFEQWTSSWRARLELAFTKACAAGCVSAAGNREWSTCAQLSSRWLELTPTSTEAALHLLNSLRASKTPEGRRAAVAAYHQLEARLQREYERPPAASVVALSQKIEERLEADGTTAASAAAEDSSVVRASIQAPATETTLRAVAAGSGASLLSPSSTRSRRSWSRQLAVAAIVVLAGAGAYAFVHIRDSYGASSAPAIVVTDIADLGHDSASAWLEDGFAQMLAADVAREANAEVIAPARVRDTRVRAELPVSGALPQQSALDIARRLGATLAVRGGFTHGAGTFVLDIAVWEVSSGRTLHSFTLTGSDPLAIAARAAARIVEGSDADAARVRFSGVETSNVLAYQHFIRALQAGEEGRITDERRELDATIALDSGFADAIIKRKDIAGTNGQRAIERRLGEALLHVRVTPWDTQTMAIDSLLHAGELARSEQLARSLVKKYPRDPRAYGVLGSVLYNEGNWTAMQATYELQLSLDSLAIGAGNGPCAPCSAYDALVGVHSQRGDLTGAEEVVRRWIALQPDLPRAWTVYSTVLSYEGRFDAAIDAQHRALTLSGGDHFYDERLARLLITARRLDAADSVARRWGAVAVSRPDLATAVRVDQLDTHVLVLRERGQLRAAVRRIDAYLATHPTIDVLRLEEIDALGRLGDFAGVDRVFRLNLGKGPQANPEDARLAGDRARYFCWTRAVEANALAASGDTLRLKALADSIRDASALSYYGRDRRLYHHVMGLVAFAGKRYKEAEDDFAAARWEIAGWTETVAWQARAELAQNLALEAIATLRDGYKGPLDAMGRYEPRSELDYLMSAAFSASGNLDSAAVYRRYANAALANADPELTRYLHSLTPRASDVLAKPTVRGRH
jgi:DNA-binding SARP family transcriptional activator/tetratricopeptide (TPR) repeat protein/TolB-like protein